MVHLKNEEENGSDESSASLSDEETLGITVV